MSSLPPIAPFAGFGVGLRTPHYQEFLTREIPVDFVEVISENFMVNGGRPLYVLDGVRERYAIAMHGVSMSLGSVDGPDPDYLARLKALANRANPLWLSDHLCWTGVDSANMHDLLPLPYTYEALEVVSRNIRFAQEYLERPLLIENPSSYVSFLADEMTEWAFLRALTAETGCFLLLDLNNIHVSAANHGFDPNTYIDAVPLDRVRQIHVAGPSQCGDIFIDTHDHAVPDAVWDIFESVTRHIGPTAMMVERDDNIPPLDELLCELNIARERAAPQSLGLAA